MYTARPSIIYHVIQIFSLYWILHVYVIYKLLVQSFSHYHIIKFILKFSLYTSHLICWNTKETLKFQKKIENFHVTSNPKSQLSRPKFSTHQLLGIPIGLFTGTCPIKTLKRSFLPHLLYVLHPFKPKQLLIFERTRVVIHFFNVFIFFYPGLNTRIHP